jgi:hypothetical protein
MIDQLYNQWVHPNTHCSGVSKSKGLQSVGANATVLYTLTTQQQTGGEMNEGLFW